MAFVIIHNIGVSIAVRYVDDVRRVGRGVIAATTGSCDKAERGE